MHRTSQFSLPELITALRVAYGREDSFKMSRGHLLADRFLIGIRTRNLPAQAVREIAARIGMPDHFRSAFLEHLDDADVVLFGIEDGDTGRIYKAYLEFWEKVRRAVMASGNREPALMNLGFKWHEQDRSIQVVSRYTCFPMLDLAGILDRVRALHEGHEDQPSCWAARRLVQFAATRRAPFIYLEVSEEGTPRSSYDINLYRANLTLAEVEPILLDAAERYALPRERFDALYSRIRTRPLGHLSGGMARDGSDFLTVYYETRPL